MRLPLWPFVWPSLRQIARSVLHLHKTWFEVPIKPLVSLATRSGGQASELGVAHRARRLMGDPAHGLFGSGWSVTAVLLVGFAGASCRSAPSAALPEPSAEAQDLFLQARLALDLDGRSLSTNRGPRGDSDKWLDALGWLTQASEMEPGWAAPRRLRDDLRVSLLQGPAVVREHWVGLQDDLSAQLDSYLIGRQLGGQGGDWFTDATKLNELDPWGWHGLAFEARRGGRKKAALRHQRTALRLAREPFERNLFAGAVARLMVEDGDIKGALGILEQAEKLCPEGYDKNELHIQWIRVAKQANDPEMSERARARTRRLLGEPNLNPSWVAGLLEGGALSTEEFAARLLDRSEPELQLFALGLFGGATRELRNALAGVPESTTRRGLFAKGEAEKAVERWWSRLPQFLAKERVEVGKGQNGTVYSGGSSLGSSSGLSLELSPGNSRPGVNEGPDMGRWLALSQAAANWQSAPDAATASELCERLLAVGWLREAQSFARSLPEGLSVQGALDVERRAGLARASLRQLLDLFKDLDRDEARVAADEEDPGAPVDSLRDLLRAVAQVLVQGEIVSESQVAAIVDSPRLHFGSFGQVVHPGPVAAPWDGSIVAEGLPIPGLAQALGNFGRVGIFGAGLGVPPDGTVLRLIASETVQGEHLSVPYRGTVLWCDGADVGARSMRTGSSVAGAALHEGYYVDVAELRNGLLAWQQWGAAWEQPFIREQLRLALTDPGLPVEWVAAQFEKAERNDGESSTVFEPKGTPWLATAPLLGQGNRVRLALLIERGTDGGLGEVRLEELVHMTATHEEGHLCERTRFLPLSKNWGEVLAFVAGEGFSPQAIQVRLEYRAQLMALCTVPEPRLALVDILDLAESTGSGLPHAPAYKDLLKDLLVVLGQAVQGGDEWVSAWQVDRVHLLAHQLHRIPPEVLRDAGLLLAKQRGLVGL